MKYILILSIFLAACSGGSSSNQDDGAIAKTEQSVILYGDSRCAWNPYIEHKNCVSGISIASVESIDFTYDWVLIHLGINGMSLIPDNEWGLYLHNLIKGNEDKVWCILPSWYSVVDPVVVQNFRYQMALVCNNLIDPNIQPFDPDGIHYTDYNFQQVAEIYNELKQP